MSYQFYSVRTRVHILAAVALASVLTLAAMFLASGAFVERLQTRQQEFSNRAEHAHRVKSLLLQLNTIGMAYVTQRDARDKVTFVGLRDQLEADLAKLDGHASKTVTPTYLEEASSYFLSLQQAFSTRERLGLTHEVGLEGTLRKAVHAIEARLFELNDHELAVDMLMMRRHEKDFMMRLDPKYLAAHQARAAHFIKTLNGRSYSPELKNSLLVLLRTYRQDFKLWSEARLQFASELGQSEQVFENLIGRISGYADNAMTEYETFTNRQQATLELTAWITWIAILVFSVGGVFATWKIGSSISVPIRKVAREMLELCEGRTGNKEQFRQKTRNEIQHLQNVLAYFRESLEETDRLHQEVMYHRDNLSAEVVKRTHELQEQTLRLEQALVQEKELNELTNQFVSTVSHEFRTPLTIIDAAARRVSKKVDSLGAQAIVERMDVIRGSVKRLSSMVEQTLDASKLANGQMQMTREDVDLLALVEEVVERHSEIAPNFEFMLIKENVPETISADARLLDHIFSNLISNAIKYSADRPEIMLSVTGEDDFVDVKIRDHGVGIPEHELPMIAGRFFRASTSKGIKGTGIGLNLVTSLVELHSGCFCIDSEEGLWTEVSIRLPVSQATSCSCSCTSTNVVEVSNSRLTAA